MTPLVVGCIRSYLTNRKWEVGIVCVVSKEADVLSGAPQGSVLGLLLFIAMIKDLLDGLQLFGRVFSDLYFGPNLSLRIIVDVCDLHIITKRGCPAIYCAFASTHPFL